MSPSARAPVVRYAPRGAALELMKCKVPEILICGPSGTGKSMAMLYKLHLACLAVPKLRALLVRRTHASLTGTTLTTFEESVATELLHSRAVTWFGGSARLPAAYHYNDNGARLLVGGLDRPEKFLSSEFDRIGIDEATEVSETALETLITRLRGKRPVFKQIIAACNPSYPTHWLKQRADAGKMVALHSRHRDNPLYVNLDGTYTDRGVEYMARLDSLSGVRRLRLRDGIWAAAEGVVYDEFDPTLSIASTFRTTGPGGGLSISDIPTRSCSSAGRRTRTAGCTCTGSSTGPGGSSRTMPGTSCASSTLDPATSWRRTRSHGTAAAPGPSPAPKG